MKQVRITVKRKASYPDLSQLYEKPIEHACTVNEGDVYLSVDAQRPDGLCESAWLSLYPFVFALAHGGRDFYDGWMKDPGSAMVSCNDGFRPVSFYLEALDD